MHWVDEWGLARLVIFNCLDDDEAVYKCKIENTLGQAESEGSLSVLKGIRSAGISLNYIHS